MNMVKAHEEIRHLTEIVITPEHEQRKESSTFRKTKNALKKDGHNQCWICGSTENLQVHHFCCEWSLESDVDYKKLKQVCELFDFYGYGEKMKNVPMTSVDDVRNMLVLCQEHHTGGMTDGVANGIHQISFPAWIAQKVCKEGFNPIPDNSGEIPQNI